LSDAFLVPVQDDIAAAEHRLELLNLTREDIDTEKRYRWKQLFLRHSRRTTGCSRAEQLYRVWQVRNAFLLHKDRARSDELLLRKEALHRIDSTARRVAEGYYTWYSQQGYKGQELLRELIDNAVEIYHLYPL
jgi:hypothetical protein